MAKQLLLIVEDDNLLSWSMEQSLCQEGYEVNCARSGEEALERIRGELPDILLLDIGLPGISGIEVLKKMCLIFVDRFRALQSFGRTHYGNLNHPFAGSFFSLPTSDCTAVAEICKKAEKKAFLSMRSCV